MDNTLKGPIWLLEDDALSRSRKPIPGVAEPHSDAITISLHRIDDKGLQRIRACKYIPSTKAVARIGHSRAACAVSLLSDVSVDAGILAATAFYGTSQPFLDHLSTLGFPYAVQLNPTTQLTPVGSNKHKNICSESAAARTWLQDAKWTELKVDTPPNIPPICYSWTHLGEFTHIDIQGHLVALAPGAIEDVSQKLLYGFIVVPSGRLREVIPSILWTRWIRQFPAKELNLESPVVSSKPTSPSTTHRTAKAPQGLRLRLSITSARQQDQDAHYPYTNDKRTLESTPGDPRRRIRTLNVIELFAGAGGMGLGFLRAGNKDTQYRLIYSGEVNLACVKTLNANYGYLTNKLGDINQERVPSEIVPIDLRAPESKRLIRDVANRNDGVDVLIGGPPCQGFSNANRSSLDPANPYNRLIDTFLEYVSLLMPRVILLENVQGILWTSKHGGKGEALRVSDHIDRSLRRNEYIVFPRVLDAVWFGVPQHRARFVLIALHKSLGYSQDDFGDWGPFPHPTHGPNAPLPYVTTRDAIQDLPSIENGALVSPLPYKAPARNVRSNAYVGLMREMAEAGIIRDHIASRHADYVLDRYQRIPPGGNWESIRGMLSNYSRVANTHSNIYRRLLWDEPAVTIGHYRKSMLVHPEQNRGLSVREAARLQSFPDWFEFKGGPGPSLGLAEKQQQIANAVCPLLTQALAEFLLTLA